MTPMPRLFSRCFCALLLFALATAEAQTLSNLWSIAPGTAGYDLVITNDQIRGVAYNPVSGNFLYIRRTGTSTGIKIKRVAGETGALLSDMNTDSAVVFGGVATLGAMAVADDGVVYACNISGTGTTTPTLRMYRWTNETSVPVLAYNSDLNGTVARVGDGMAVRGSGTDTLVLIGSDQLTVAFLRTTSPNGALGSWNTTKVTISGGIGNFYKSVAFGVGNSFYGKTSGNTLHRVNFDLTCGSATFVMAYSTGIVPATVAGLAFDPVNQIMLGVTRSSTSGVNHTNYLWDFSSVNAPTRIDARIFPTANSDGAAGITGAALGGGKAFCSVQNNGLVAYRLDLALRIVSQPQTMTVVQGADPTLSVSATTGAPLTYQWMFNGNAIAGATNSLLTLSNAQPANAGSYAVQVSNGSTNISSSNAMVSITAAVHSRALTPLWSLAPGSRAYLANDSVGGMAYNPINGNVLLVSRTCGNNAVQVLDQDTGAHLHSLAWDNTLISGGTLAVNGIGVTDDGIVYVGNVTTNGTTSEFRLYTWVDDSPSSLPMLAWHGDPGAGTPNRWGDTMIVRLGADFQQVLLGSRSGTSVSLIRPIFGPTSAATVIDVSGATAGDFAQGPAFGGDDTIWSKSTSGKLLKTALDLNTGTGSVLANFSGYGAIGPIGVDVGNNLLAGISIETPDNLRLFDIGGTTPINVDTKFFPADNANSGSIGSVVFGFGRLFALDGGNGLMAFAVDATCLPDTLQIERFNSSIMLLWDRPNYRLEAATELLDPPSMTKWQPTGDGAPAIYPADGRQQFFRLVCP